MAVGRGTCVTHAHVACGCAKWAGDPDRTTHPHMRETLGRLHTTVNSCTLILVLCAHPPNTGEKVQPAMKQPRTEALNTGAQASTLRRASRRQCRRHLDATTAGSTCAHLGLTASGASIPRPRTVRGGRSPWERSNRTACCRQRRAESMPRSPRPIALPRRSALSRNAMTKSCGCAIVRQASITSNATHPHVLDEHVASEQA